MTTATAVILPFGYTRRRPCLVCKQQFVSAGAHNVVCLPCRMKDRDDWD